MRNVHDASTEQCNDLYLPLEFGLHVPHHNNRKNAQREIGYDVHDAIVDVHRSSARAFLRTVGEPGRGKGTLKCDGQCTGNTPKDYDAELKLVREMKSASVRTPVREQEATLAADGVDQEADGDLGTS